MKRIAVISVGVLLVLVLALVLIGWRLPVSHVATRSVRLEATPESVFALISRPEEYPKWRSDVKSVEVTQQQGVTRFTEQGGDGAILFEVVEQLPPRRMVTRIADKSLPFGGRWIFEVLPAGDGSDLRITEEGEVYNPIFRFVSRFMIGHTASIDRYLSAVQKRLE